MERIQISQRELEITQSLGGADYEPKDYEESGNVHYSSRGGHAERSRFHKELVKRAIALGTGISIVLGGCVPSNSEAYYSPFTDKITYITTPLPETVIHEETHQERAREAGTWWWGVQYLMSPDFRCLEEQEANSSAGITDIHPACIDK